MRILAASIAIAFAVTLLLSDSAVGAEDAIEAALDNVSVLVRAGKVGYATVFDGNKFVQSRRLADGALRCEAAGSAMQPSLTAVLTPERKVSLETEGWSIDPAFGLYVHTFPKGTSVSEIAGRIRATNASGGRAEGITPIRSCQAAWT